MATYGLRGLPRGDWLFVEPMKLRLQALSDVDPLRVPLPHGTEVISRVDARLHDRVISKGAVGRVVGFVGDRFEVAIVGVGKLVFDRDQLRARKKGQLAFAVRREAAWQALRSTVVLETVVGSNAWGLAEESSDIDRRGVFVLPFGWTAGLVDAPQDLVSADGSENHWEIGKAIRLALAADPNLLETLLLPTAKATDPMGEWILEARDVFASIEVYGTFGRYALSQLKRLRQGLRLREHRHLLLKWLAAAPLMSREQAAIRLAKEAEIKTSSKDNATTKAASYIKQLYSSMYDQGLLAERDYASLVAFAANNDHTFELPRAYRPKNAYNLLRLLFTATAWLRTGTPDFVMRGAIRDELMAVKRGQIPLPKMMSRADELASELEQARACSVLPEHPDVERADELLRRIRSEASRRFHEQAAGPFGANAAKPPPVSWT